MSQQFTEDNQQEIPQCCKVYNIPDKYYINYPKKEFFKLLVFGAFFGVLAFFRSKHPHYEYVPLSFRVTTGLANLVLVGLIGAGIGLCLGSPAVLIAAVICTLIGLGFDVYAVNKGREMDTNVIDLKTGSDLGQYLGETIQGKIKNKEIQIVPITEKITNNLKQKCVID